MNGSLHHAALSDIGRIRATNQDRWFADDDLGLYIVADGVGGQRAGGLAAQIVIETLPLLVSQQMRMIDDLSGSRARQELRGCLKTLSLRLRDESRGEPGLDGISSTVVLALIRNRQALIAHMGDSRAYLLRDGELKQLTADHSLTHLLVAAGEISAEDAVSHPSRGQLTRCVGMDGIPVADVQSLTFGSSKERDCKTDTPVRREFTAHHLDGQECPSYDAGERLLLCSDGLTKTLTDAEITPYIGGQRSLDQACKYLIERVNAVGGEDNVTVILIERSR